MVRSSPRLIIVIIIIAPSGTLSDEKSGEIQSACKACQANITVGGLFTDTA